MDSRLWEGGVFYFMDLWTGDALSRFFVVVL